MYARARASAASGGSDEIPHTRRRAGARPLPDHRSAARGPAPRVMGLPYAAAALPRRTPLAFARLRSGFAFLGAGTTLGGFAGLRSSFGRLLSRLRRLGSRLCGLSFDLLLQLAGHDLDDDRARVGVRRHAGRQRQVANSDLRLDFVQAADVDLDLMR